MVKAPWNALACAFRLAGGAGGCASTRSQQSSDPSVRQVRAPTRSVFGRVSTATRAIPADTARWPSGRIQRASPESSTTFSGDRSGSPDSTVRDSVPAASA